MDKPAELTKWVADPSRALLNERVLLRKRAHWYAVVERITAVTFIFLGIAFLIGLFFFHFLKDPILFFIILAILLILYTNTIIKFIMDWYCHFYILTNRRIMEISYSPLFFKDINNVIISQVKATEIDVEMEGILCQILDMGNVIVTFDRPTHTQEFRLENIHDPESAGLLLAESLDLRKKETMDTPIWTHKRDKEHPFGVIEEIFSGESLEVT